MELISNNEINNIRSSVDIVDIISSYIPLTQKGKNYFGVCPFHDDNNPSMSVSKEKQIYKCFSCGATGNVFTFIMNYEHISFYESVARIAQVAGINIDINISRTSKLNKNSDLYDIYDLSHKLYQNNLNTELGKNAKEYLKNRNINEDVIKEFGIGLSLKKRDVLFSVLKKKNYKFDLMLKSGLINKSEKGYNDVYYNRIMFPLYDLNGQVVGFSGRIYDMNDNSKYINTKETEIFKKGELLYNYHRAKEISRKTDTVIIMEGFMDVIRAYTIGVCNVVAMMGTAVTKYQANLIKRMAKNVILCFDGDEAGVKATLSCADELIKLGVSPKVVALENNLDPDEYIKKYGAESFLKKIENSISIMDFKLSKYKNKINITNTEELASYVNKVIDDLNNIDDDILRELTLRKLSEETKLDYEFLKNKLSEQDNKNDTLVIFDNNSIQKRKLNQKMKAIYYLVYYMLRSKEAIKKYIKSGVYIDVDNIRFLAREIEMFYKNNKYIDIADFISTISMNNDLMSALSEVQVFNLKEECTIEEIEDYIAVIKRYNIDNYCKSLIEKMKNETDSTKKALIAQEIINMKVRGDNND